MMVGKANHPGQLGKMVLEASIAFNDVRVESPEALDSVSGDFEEFKD